MSRSCQTTTDRHLKLESHQQILLNVADGSQKAFKDLYDLYNQKVYNTAISHLQDEKDAEEVTQDVFMTIFRKAKQFEGKSSLSTWIYRITINTSINFSKKKKRFTLFRLSEQETEVSHFEHPGVLLENKEDTAYLFKAIESLPESQKAAFVLSFIEGLPRQEVADILETSLKATESLLQRAKGNLRKKLEIIHPHRRN
ncbi:RNA polymerase sigma factor [Owenweeksia hongkongensis]|uniref:RNA polymerase sigma factor n=1 Tax=Owenweeksia hongkongensis TaxID=253245 RepID=UPI003A8F09D7